MTTYSPAAPRARFSHLSVHLRTYVAAVGATAALTTGVLVAFLSVATFVAFSGFPFVGSSDDAGNAYLESSLSAAPGAAGLALGAARSAVADDPVAGSAGAGAGAGTAGAEASGGAGSGGVEGSNKAPSAGGPSDPGTDSPPGDVASPPIVVPSLPSTSGPTTDAVQSVDTAAGTNLSGPTRGVTRPVDGAGTGALDQAGGAAGLRRLGTQSGGAVGGVTGSALGG